MNDGSPISVGIGERLARLESGQEWTKLILGVLAAVTIGGFAFLGLQISRLDARFDGQISRLDAKVDSLGARISAEGAATRQELIGIATAISNSITAARQIQPQILPVPWPPQPAPNSPPAKQ